MSFWVLVFWLCELALVVLGWWYHREKPWPWAVLILMLGILGYKLFGFPH